MRRLFWDLEVSPNQILSWRIGRKLSVGYENIVIERQIICVTWKWEHEKRVYALDWGREQNDKSLLKQFNEVIKSSDEAVAHFGDGFDWPWFLARCLIVGIPTNHLIKTVDTCKMARRLHLNSFKLDYLAKILGVGEKLDTDFGLWRKVVIDKNESALRQMVRYGKVDVQILEGVYHKLAESAPAKTHAGVEQGKERWSCPACASTKTKTSKTRISPKGVKQYQMQCENGHYYSISEKVHADYLKR